MQTQYTTFMKTAVIPQIRVEPELRADLESVLKQGETLTDFVEATVRAVWKCSPLHVPLEKYDTWKQLLLHFDPSGMLG